MPEISNEQLLAEFEDLLRCMPSWDNFYYHKDEIYPWCGRAKALINSAADIITKSSMEICFDQLCSSKALDFDGSLRKVKTAIHQIIYDLRLDTVGPLTTVIEEGSVYKYFDVISKQIESAKLDLLFIDPYLDHEFVQYYLPYVTQGVSVRLLTSKKLDILLPAVSKFAKERNINVEVRSIDGLHDRYLFVDQQACYQSGASFKDGAKKAPTTFSQITDAFEAMLSTYEKKWQEAVLVNI